MAEIREVLYQHHKGATQRKIEQSLSVSRMSIRKYVILIITTNRKIEGWMDLFHDPVMANAALDRIVNKAYRIVLDGDSYRKKLIPKFDAKTEA